MRFAGGRSAAKRPEQKALVEESSPKQVGITAEGAFTATCAHAGGGRCR